MRTTLRRTLGALLVAVVLPASARAQAVTYSFLGTFAGPTGTIVGGFTLTGDAANVLTSTTADGFVAYVNPSVDGLVSVGGQLQPVSGWTIGNVAAVPPGSGQQPFLYVSPSALPTLAPGLQLLFGALAGADLRVGFGPVSVKAGAAITSADQLVVVEGSGTFAVTVDGAPPGSVVPEPATWTLLAAGLAATVAARARTRRGA